MCVLDTFICGFVHTNKVTTFIFCRQNLTQSEDLLKGLHNEILNTEGHVEEANIHMDDIRSRVDNLKRLADELKDNATSIREQDVSGMYFLM